MGTTGQGDAPPGFPNLHLDSGANRHLTASQLSVVPPSPPFSPTDMLPAACALASHIVTSHMVRCELFALSRSACTRGGERRLPDCRARSLRVDA